MRNTKQEIESAGLTEIELLAQLELIFEGELRCESPHVDGAGLAHKEGCLIEVVAIRFTACGVRSGILVCRAVADWKFNCGGCSRPVAESWKIIPI